MPDPKKPWEQDYSSNISESKKPKPWEQDYSTDTLKKKEHVQSGSQLSFQEKVSALKSPPKTAYDILVTDQPKQVQGSGTSSGKVKISKPTSYVMTPQQMEDNKKAIITKAHGDISELKQPTYQDHVDAQEEAKSDFADTGFLNTAATLGKKAWNAIADINTLMLSGGTSDQAPDMLRFDTDRSKKYIDQATKEHAQEVNQANKQKVFNKDFKVPAYDQEQIKKRAFDLAVQERVGKKTQSRVNDYMRNIDGGVFKDISDTWNLITGKPINTENQIEDKQQLVLNSDIQEQPKQVKQAQNLLNVSAMSKKEADASQAKINNYVNIFKSYKDKGQAVPQEVANQFLIDSKYNEEAHKIAVQDSNDAKDSVAKLQDTNQNIDIFNREYGFSANTLRNLTSASLSIGSGIMGGADYTASLEKEIANRIGIHFLDPILGTASKVARYSSKKLKEGAEYVESGSEKIGSVNNASDFGRFVFNEVVAKNAPMLAAIGAGPIGIGAVVSSSVGETFESQQEQEDAGDRQYSFIQKYGIPAAHGAVDLALFTFDGQMLRDAKRVIQGASSVERTTMAQGALDQLLKQPVTLKGIAQKQIHGLAVMNGVTMSKNIIDIVGGVHPDKNITDGTFDASAASLILVGLTNTVPSLAAKAVHEITSDARPMRLSGELLAIEKQLRDHTIPKENRDMLQDLHDKTSERLRVKLGKQIKNIQSLSNSQYKEVVDINKQIIELKNKAQEVKNGSATDAVKDPILNGMAREFIKANKRKGELVENGAKAQYERLSKEEQNKYYSQAESRLNKELNPDGTKKEKATPEEIIKEAMAAKNMDLLNEKPEPVVETPASEDLSQKKTEEANNGEISEVSVDEIEALKEDVDRGEKEGSLSDNVGEKIYRGNEEGNLEIEGQQYVFRTGDKIHELGNVDEVGSQSIASLNLSLFPKEGMKTEPITPGEKPTVVSVDGKEYTFVKQRRPKKGESVVVLKENEGGLIRTFKGPKAERILKDIDLQKPVKENVLNLTVEGKPILEEPVKSDKDLKREAKANKLKEQQEFEAKSLKEIEDMQKQLDEEADALEKEMLKDIKKESDKEKRMGFSVDGKDYIVTDKDGEWSVSQKNEKGKYIGVRDEVSRTKAIEEYQSIRKSRDSQRLKDAEDLASQNRSEGKDKIEAALNKAIEATSTKGKLYDATLGLPLMMANSALKIVRAAYRGGKSLAEALADGYQFIKDKGYGTSEHDFKKYVLENINKTEEIKDLKDNAKDAIQAERTVGKIEKNEALDKQREEFKAEKEKIKKSIKDKIIDSKEAVKNINKIVGESLDLTKLNSGQLKAILNKAQKIFTYVNLDNGIANFVNHIDKVINDVDYQRKIDNLNVLREKAVKNLYRAKVDFSNSTIDVVSKLLSIHPEHISPELVGKYTDIMNKLGGDADKKIQKLKSEMPNLSGESLRKKQNELNTLVDSEIKQKADLINSANEIIDDFQSNRNKVIELSDAYNSFIEDNNLQGEPFSKVIKAMEVAGNITEAEAKLMNENSDYYVERKSREGVKSTEKDRATLNTGVDTVLTSLKSKPSSDQRLSSLDAESRKVADDVIEGISKEYLDSLSDNELETVLNELNSLDGGFVTGNLKKEVANGIDIFNRSKAIKETVDGASIKMWEGLKSKTKALFFRMKGVNDVRSTAIWHQIQGAHNNVIDTVVNNLKNNDLFKNTSDKAAKMFGKAKTYIAMKSANEINPLAKMIDKQSNGDSVKIMESNIKMSLYMYQKMHETSLNKKKDLHVEDYVKNINQNKVYNDDTLALINKAYESFKAIEFDSQKWRDSNLTEIEKKVVDGIRKFYDSDIRDKAKSTTYFDEGRILDTSNPNYIPVDFAFKDGSEAEVKRLIDNKAEAFYRPSVKAGNLMEKSGSAGGSNKSLNMTNPFKTMETYLTDTSMQYHLMNEVRTGNKVFDKLSKDQSLSKESLDLVNAMKESNNKIVRSYLENAYNESSQFGVFIDNKVVKPILSGAGKFVAESVGNAINALNHTEEVIAGIKLLSDKLYSVADIDNIIYNLGLSQGYRYVGKAHTMDNAFSSQGGADMALDKRVKMDKNIPGPVLRVVEKLYRKSKTKAAVEQVDNISEYLRRTPDKVVSKPLAIGIFSKRFEKMSGQSPDWKKIAAGDTEYMKLNKENIELAVSASNVESSLVIGTQNPYEKAGKQVITKDSSWYAKANGFLQGYSMAQGAGLQVAIKNLLYNGQISKTEASVMIAQRVASQAAYLAISTAIGGAFLSGTSKLMDNTQVKDNEEDEKRGNRVILSSAMQLAMSRTGAIGSNLFAYGFENLSEKYGQGTLYEGEYTKGKSTMFSAYNPANKPVENAADLGLSMLGGRNVVLAKGKEVIKDITDSQYKTAALDFFGGLGYVPFYKDINKIVDGVRYKTLPSEGSKKNMSGTEVLETQKNIKNALEKTVYNSVSANIRLQNKDIDQKEFDKIKEDNMSVINAISKLGVVDNATIKDVISSAVEKTKARIGVYKNVERFRKMDTDAKEAYLYDMIKKAKSEREMSDENKEELKTLIKVKLIKQKNVSDVVKYYKKYN